MKMMMSPRSLCLCLAASLLVAVPALAAKPATPLEQTTFWPQAQAGNAEAEVKAGKAYESGQGVARDYAQAETWFQKAADQGSLDGSLALGELYFNGHGVGRDFATAEKYMEAPAEQGNARAQYYLGWLYAHGQGVRFQDFNKAAEWLTRAANQNDGQAQQEMGDLSFSGSGVAQNYEDAYVWYLLAANHKQGKGVAKKLQKSLNQTRLALTAAQLASAQARARDWKPVMEAQKK